MSDALHMVLSIEGSSNDECWSRLLTVVTDACTSHQEQGEWPSKCSHFPDGGKIEVLTEHPLTTLQREVKQLRSRLKVAMQLLLEVDDEYIEPSDWTNRRNEWLKGKP